MQTKRSISSWTITLGLAILVAAVSTGNLARAQESLEYNRDIRPILADTCFACHGPDSAARQADLRLDQRDAAIEMGAIAPGDPDESEMIRRILSSDPDEMMPPPETKKSLTTEQKDRLSRWIRNDAEYQLHWSLIPPERPQPPDVKHADWLRKPDRQLHRVAPGIAGAATVGPSRQANSRSPCEP